MPSAAVVDFQTVSAVLVAAFAMIGLVQGGARTVVVVGAGLAVIVALGEPATSAKVLLVAQKVHAVICRAVGRQEPIPVAEPGPFFFLVYLCLLVAVALVSRALIHELTISKASRFFGGALGVLNGLLFSLVMREHLLPYLGRNFGGTWTIHVRLQPEVSAQTVSPVAGVSVGTIAYLFGLLLAGAGLVRRFRGARGPGL